MKAVLPDIQAQDTLHLGRATELHLQEKHLQIHQHQFESQSCPQLVGMSLEHNIRKVLIFFAKDSDVRM